mmetsp:Transcript_5286/g.14740  ORF Transcript_5286/g.14740 Transcript_5286/m.14740 type:complete len:234 (+) Transcript_5286:281-982(+)
MSRNGLDELTCHIAAGEAKEGGSELNRAIAAAVARDITAKGGGDRSWKTLARRSDGPSCFRFGDLIRAARSRISYRRRRRRGDKLQAGKPCPICAECEPEPDAEGKRWQHLYCGCTVCSNCVGNWNVHLLDDAEASNSQSGLLPAKLRCPVCSTPLRPADTVQVLTRCPFLGTKYQELARDVLLRSMPGWRSCPRCNGGGFTTPECLAPIHADVGMRIHTPGVHVVPACLLRV